MKAVRFLALLANLGWFLFVLIMSVSGMMRVGIDWVGVAITLAVFAAIALNVVAILSSTVDGKPTLIGLFFAVRRAKLEQQLATLKSARS